MHFEIVTPERKVAEETVEFVSVPGLEGDFGVLEGHVPTITSLRPGVMLAKVGKTNRVYAVSGGVADIQNNSVTILAEDIIVKDDLNGVDVEAELKAAEAELASLAGTLSMKAKEAAAERRVARAKAMLELKNVDLVKILDV